ncbi:MAG: AbrB/MazE/SpoVT family DNA-binding domain-containing protein [Firmicutes bacterium]|nr:AbrB/MazE/SpoVT family DNA-binding domain-containing protein [Bacillota bacterium]
MKVKVSGRGQICLPGAYRKRLDIAPGDVLEVVESGGSLVLRPPRKKRNKKEVAVLLERTSGIWGKSAKDGAEIVREIRRGSTRDVWGD